MNDITANDFAPDSNVEEGTYIAEIMSIETEELGGGGQLIAMKFTATHEEKGNQVQLEKKYHIKSKQAAAFLKREMALIGFTPKDRTEFEADKSKLVGKKLRLQVVFNDQGFQCYYIKGLHTESEGIPPSQVDIGW